MKQPANRSLPLTAPADDQQAGSLGRQVRKGVVWSGTSNIVLRICNILIMVVVARLVSPAELGVFALAITIHAFIVTVAELGVASALLRNDVDVERLAPTATLIAWGFSAFLAAIMAICAGPIAVALGNPEAERPIRILSIGIFLIGPYTVPGALLQREFRQDLIFRAQLIGFVPGGIFLIVLASFSNGAEAFAWSRVTGQAISVVATVLIARRFYRPKIERAVLRPLLTFGIPLAGANLLSQVLLNIDYVFLGRMMTAADVGIYMLAFGVAAWPMSVIGAILTGLTLPAFSAVSRDGAELERALRNAVGVISIVSFPIAAFTAAFAVPVVRVLYGAQWTAAAQPLRVLSLYGAIFVFSALYANILPALGRTKLLLIVQAIALLCFVPSLYAGIRIGGLVGVGVAHSMVILFITLPIYLLTIRRATGVAVLGSLSPIIRPVIAAAAAAVGALAATYPISSSAGKLAVGWVVGAIIYFAVMAKVLVSRLPAQLRTLAPVTWLSRITNEDDGSDGGIPKAQQS
jgi:lipopolysaccharide exporter